MATFKVFGPLVRVPAAVLNAIQAGTMDSKANGPANTMGLGLNAESLANVQRRVHMSLGSVDALALTLMDNSIDWRDRTIDVSSWFDPFFDVRPGKGQDLNTAFEQVSLRVYTGSGGKSILLGSNVSLTVSNVNGNMNIIKTSGYVHIRIVSGLQVKERS